MSKFAIELRCPFKTALSSHRRLRTSLTRLTNQILATVDVLKGQVLDGKEVLHPASFQGLPGCLGDGELGELP